MNAARINYRIAGLVKINDRGQFVLPKELRRKLSIKGGDKLAIITCEKDENIHFILVKAENLTDSLV